MRELLAVITNRRDRALFLLAYRHGLRASEVGLLALEEAVNTRAAASKPAAFRSRASDSREWLER